MASKMIKMKDGSWILVHCGCGTDPQGFPYTTAVKQGAEIVHPYSTVEPSQCIKCQYYVWTWCL